MRCSTEINTVHAGWRYAADFAEPTVTHLDRLALRVTTGRRCPADNFWTRRFSRYLLWDPPTHTSIQDFWPVGIEQNYEHFNSAALTALYLQHSYSAVTGSIAAHSNSFTNNYTVFLGSGMTRWSLRLWQYCLSPLVAHLKVIFVLSICISLGIHENTGTSLSPSPDPLLLIAFLCFISQV